MYIFTYIHRCTRTQRDCPTVVLVSEMALQILLSPASTLHPIYLSVYLSVYLTVFSRIDL